MSSSLARLAPDVFAGIKQALEVNVNGRTPGFSLTSSFNPNLDSIADGLTYNEPATQEM